VPARSGLVNTKTDFFSSLLEDVERAKELLSEVAPEGSKLRVQIHTESRYAAFVKRAQRKEVLGLQLPVAAMEDVLQGKVWDIAGSNRRGSQRQLDMVDIVRLIEEHPELESRVPADVLAQIPQ
jgi:hypothetical protein